MIFEYAVNPKVFVDAAHCQLVFESFKGGNGRVVSDVPRDWVKLAFKEIGVIRCKPVMRKSIKNALKKLRDESLCKARECESDAANTDWFEGVEAANTTYPFSAVISDDDSHSVPPVYDLDGLALHHPDCWNEPAEKYVKRTAADIVDAMVPLLVLSNELAIVDQYFYPGRQQVREVLTELFRRNSEFNFGAGLSRITIHISDDSDNIESRFKRAVSGAPDTIKIDCFGRPKSFEHDRFVITNIGGIHSGEGFSQTGGGSDELLFRLLTPTIWKRLKAKLCDDSTVHCTHN